MVGELVERGEFNSRLVEIDAFVGGVAFLLFVLDAVIDENPAHFRFLFCPFLASLLCISC